MWEHTGGSTSSSLICSGAVCSHTHISNQQLVNTQQKPWHEPKKSLLLCWLVFSKTVNVWALTLKRNHSTTTQINAAYGRCVHGYVDLFRRKYQWLVSWEILHHKTFNRHSTLNPVQRLNFIQESKSLFLFNRPLKLYTSNWPPLKSQRVAAESN